VAEARDRENDIVGRMLIHQDVIEGDLKLKLRDPDAARGVALGIRIDEERPAFRDRERRGEVDGSRGLTDAALLISDCDRICHDDLAHKCLMDNDLRSRAAGAPGGRVRQVPETRPIYDQAAPAPTRFRCFT
jgi:hypothetical protein